MGHWRRVITDRKYRRNWAYYVGASTSSWWFVFAFGGHYGGTLSAEIERRRVNGRPLGAVLSVVKALGGVVLGPAHWAKSYFNERHWLHLTRQDSSMRDQATDETL